MDPGYQTRCRVLLLAVFATLMAACLSYQASIARLDTAALPRPWLNAPFVRTPNAIVDAMLELAAPRESDLLYDLGCGDGRIVVRAAKKYGCRAVGFDLAPERVEEAREIARLQGLEDRVTIVEQDIFTLDLAEADIVTLYLLPRLNQRLIPQLKRLRPGTRVVSHEFDLPGIVPERAVSITPADDQREHTLYLWIAPLREKSP